GSRAILVDPRQTAHGPGRPKSDVLDCQWIRRLHSYGLLTGAFRPADEIVRWRGFQRQREMLIRYAAQHIQHMQKVLEEMNVKLTEVVSDIVGQTGMKILRDIVRGVRDPVKLAKHRHELCKATKEQIAAALCGNWRPELLFALRQGGTAAGRLRRPIGHETQATLRGQHGDASLGPPGLWRHRPEAPRPRSH